MREALFILAVVVLLLGFTAFRYRKQIGTAIGFWRALRKMRDELREPRAGPVNGIKEKVEGPLVNCSKCGTWVPEDNAIKLGRNIYFCSSKCLEQNVRTA